MGNPKEISAGAIAQLEQYFTSVGRILPEVYVPLYNGFLARGLDKDTAATFTMHAASDMMRAIRAMPPPSDES